MDRVRDLLRKRIAERGLDMAKVSRAIGRNHAYMQQYLSLGKPKELPEKVREALAGELELSPESLRERESANPSLSSVSENGPMGETTEEKIMRLVNFLKELRQGQEEAFDKAIARILKEAPEAARPPRLVGRTS